MSNEGRFGSTVERGSGIPLLVAFIRVSSRPKEHAASVHTIHNCPFSTLLFDCKGAKYPEH